MLDYKDVKILEKNLGIKILKVEGNFIHYIYPDGEKCYMSLNEANKILKRLR